MTLTRIDINVNERTSGVYRATIVDENGNAVSAATLAALTLTLYDQASNTKINSRNAQNVLNANQVTVDSLGRLVWNWLPADTDLVDQSKGTELHTALFEATWNGNDGLPREITHEVIFRVQRMRNV